LGGHMMLVVMMVWLTAWVADAPRCPGELVLPTARRAGVHACSERV
jgi:hypothetical protein